jgi:hypothetical protein
VRELGWLRADRASAIDYIETLDRAAPITSAQKKGLSLRKDNYRELSSGFFEAVLAHNQLLSNRIVSIQG